MREGPKAATGGFCKKKFFLKISLYIKKKTPELGSLFNKVVGLEACNFIEKRLQLRCFPLNIAKFLKTPIMKNICERLLFWVLERTSCHLSLSVPTKTQKNESLRYFQWVYKETNGAEWVHTSLYKNIIFVCVSVDQALTSKEKDVKNLKCADLLSRGVSITLINIKSQTYLLYVKTSFS